MNSIRTLTRHYLAPVLVTFTGGYLFIWGLTGLGIVGLVLAGVDFHQAETAMLLIAFPVLLAVFLWRFASRRPLAVVLALFTAGALMSVAASLLQRALLT